jgi:hypothetical protein
MEMSIYAPTPILAPAPLRKDQPRCVRGVYHPCHATRILLRGVNIAFVAVGLGVTFGVRREAVGLVLVFVRLPSLLTALPPPLPLLPLPILHPSTFPLSSPYSRQDAVLTHLTAPLARTVQFHIHPLLAYSSTRLESVCGYLHGFLVDDINGLAGVVGDAKAV